MKGLSVFTFLPIPRAARKCPSHNQTPQAVSLPSVRLHDEPLFGVWNDIP
jgi:hypothetical protein